MSSSDQGQGAWRVVVNHEEQYSIWPLGRDNPLGWRDAGKSGTRDECLAWIREVWTDMRPLSLRKEMENSPPTPPSPPPADEPEMDHDLVSRLSDGEHRVELAGTAEDKRALLREQLERDWLIVRFPDTRGGTVLGFRPDPERTDLGDADLEAGSGRVHTEGELTLDGVRVRCILDLDVPSMSGRGRLQAVSGE